MATEIHQLNVMLSPVTLNFHPAFAGFSAARIASLERLGQRQIAFAASKRQSKVAVDGTGTLNRPAFART
jgi:hypothetical protein